LCSLTTPVFDDEVHIHRARRLRPGDPDLLYVCGLLDFQAGRVAAALAGWKASLALAPRYLNDVVQIAGARLASPGGIAQVLPDSPELLVRLARQEFADDEPIRARLLARAEEILPQSDLAEAERLHLAGAIGALRKNYPEAIDYYFRAVALRSRQVGLALRAGPIAPAAGPARRSPRASPLVRAARTQASQAQEALGRNPLCAVDAVRGVAVVGGWWLVVGGWWLVVGGWWLVVGGWWLVVGGWWLVVGGWQPAFRFALTIPNTRYAERWQTPTLKRDQHIHTSDGMNLIPYP
jgi:tetratricopeptide (TPR) repeat protein